jgi:hypothetical protein
MTGRPQYGTRRDANQAAITSGLEELGFVVLDVSQLAHLGFDILVCGYHGDYHLPLWLAVEVKTAEGKLTDRERKVQMEMAYKFRRETPLIVARDIDDVLRWYARL